MLWEEHYKSFLAQEEKYLLEVYKYIEMNPVRAKLVEDTSEYLGEIEELTGRRLKPKKVGRPMGWRNRPE